MFWLILIFSICNEKNGDILSGMQHYTIEALESRALLSSTFPDANHDHHVDGKDFAIVALNFNRDHRTFEQGDFNGDGKVNALDFNLLASAYGDRREDNDVVNVVSSPIYHSPDSTNDRIQATGWSTTTGKTMVVIVTGQKASGVGPTFTISDTFGNSYATLGTAQNGTTHTRIAIYLALQATGGGVNTLTITPSASASVTFQILEIASDTGAGLWAVANHVLTQTGTAFENDLACVGTDLVLGAITQTSGSPVAVTNNLTTLATFDGTGGDLPLATQYSAAATGSAFASIQTYLSSVPGVSVACAIGEYRSATNTSGPAPTYRFDVRDLRVAAGTANMALPEHSGGTAGTSSGSGFAVNSFLDQGLPSVVITAGAGSGLFLPYHGSLGAVAICAAITKGVAGSIAGMDDVGSGAHGAWYLSNDASNNLLGQVNTTLGSAAFGSTKAEAIGGLPAVYWILFDGTNAIVESNGFEVVRLALSGTPLTPNASNGLRILNAWASGGDATPSTGSVYEVRCYSTLPTFTQRRLIDSEMAWPLGPLPTKKYTYYAGTSNADANNIHAISESDDGVTWVNGRNTSYREPTGATLRDTSIVLNYNSSGISYVISTVGPFTPHDKKYLDIAKFRDPRLLVNHGSLSFVGAVTGTIFAPCNVVDPATGKLHICAFAPDDNVIIDTPVNDLSTLSFGAKVTMTGLLGSDPCVLAPGDPRNTFGAKWVAYTGLGIRQWTADALDGPWTLRSTITTNSAEGPFAQDINGIHRLYIVSNYIDSTGNDGQTFDLANVQTTTGWNPAPGVLPDNEIEQGEIYPTSQFLATVTKASPLLLKRRRMAFA